VLFPRVTDVSVLPPYGLALRFADGSQGVVDCADLILGRDAGVFSALRDPAEFARVYVHPEARTVAWPHNLDLCPDVLYARANSLPIPVE